MKPVPIAFVGLLALAGCSGKIASRTDLAQAGATLTVRLKRILVAAVACFALGCTSAQAQDMALNKPASASSTENNRTDLRPALANDGNSSTRWSSNFVDSQWWQVDLGSIRQIDRVELNWETAYASRYRIQTRTSTLDSWSTAATVTILSPGPRVHTFPVRNAQYVRIQDDQRATLWGISLWDVRVFGPTSSPSPDGDGDGVPDSTDQCSTQPGPASNGGCPPSADCPTGQYLARYWSNQTLSGSPALSRCEASINNDFGTGSPPGVPADGFSARYEGTVSFDAGNYEFALGGDDGVRLYIDGVRVIDRWVDQAFTTYRHTQTMTAGQHTIRVEFYEDGGLARVDLDFARVTQSPQTTGFPNALNTGVPPGTTLEPHNGNLTVNTSGTVISNKLINGCVTVNAPNVTIRRSKVVCSGPSAIWSGSTGLLVEDTEVDCNNAAGRTAITPQGYTARRVNAHGCENIFWASRNVLIEDSYIHDPIPCCTATQPHTDSIQIPAGGSNITIDHNTVYGGYISQSNFGNAAITGHRLPLTDITINNNLLAGGGYTVYCPQGVGSNYRITNNRFSRIFVFTVGGFGPWVDCTDEPGASGNVYHESGRPL